MKDILIEFILLLTGVFVIRFSFTIDKNYRNPKLWTKEFWIHIFILTVGVSIVRLY